jgi:hypothetical protein
LPSQETSHEDASSCDLEEYFYLIKNGYVILPSNLDGRQSESINKIVLIIFF